MQRVPGIDSLLIGTSDLSMELGIPGQLADERIVDAYGTAGRSSVDRDIAECGNPPRALEGGVAKGSIVGRSDRTGVST
jgi:hypothetical protein